MEQTHFPWFWVVFLLISTLSAIIAYDIYSSKTFKGQYSIVIIDCQTLSLFLKSWICDKKRIHYQTLILIQTVQSHAIVASRTVRFLEDYGILAFTEQVWSKLSHYTMIAYRLVPTYISTSTMHLQKNFHFEQTILKTLSWYLLILATSLIRKKCTCMY